MINTINLAGMVWLSYTVGHPTDVAELLSTGKTPTCLVMRNEVLEASNPREKHRSFPFIRRKLRSLKTISQDLSRQSPLESAQQSDPPRAGSSSVLFSGVSPAPRTEPGTQKTCNE